MGRLFRPIEGSRKRHRLKNGESPCRWVPKGYNQNPMGRNFKHDRDVVR